MTLARKSNEALDRETLKKEQRAKDAAKAVAQYEAEGKAVHEKTARLRALRLAKQAAEGTSLTPVAKVIEGPGTKAGGRAKSKAT